MKASLKKDDETLLDRDRCTGCGECRAHCPFEALCEYHLVFKRIPLHPFLFTAYPVLALLAHNIREVEAGAALRPLAVSLAGGAVIFLLLGFIVRSWSRAGVITSLMAVLFFSYGHLYGILEGTTILGFQAGRHRYLLAVFLALAVGAWWGMWKLKDVATATGMLNLAGVALLFFPLNGLVTFEAGAARVEASLTRQASARGAALSLEPLEAQAGKKLPDIYYLILDGYSRADALKEDTGYDNSPFLDELRGLGFTVADCSRSNYRNTLKSVTSSLNMDYLQTLAESLSNGNQGEVRADSLWVLLKHSRVRAQLEALGYKTVAFETGYEWSRLEDADYYLGLKQRRFELQSITAFEAMLAKSTALLPLIESGDKALADRFQVVNYPYSENISRHLYILETLPRIAENPEPTFTFAHILVTHPPYVFGPDGELLSERGYYGDHGYPINEEYAIQGYTGTIRYLNTRLLAIVRALLAQSEQTSPGAPPVIIFQADHGLKEEKRHAILNAYYLSDAAKQWLYPTITPVNTFRVVFNAYFGASYPLLPDISYDNHNPPQETPEVSPGCKTT